MYRVAEDGRALLEAAKEVHAERHGAQTFLPGTCLSFLEAAKRSGIRSDRQRYHDAIEDLWSTRGPSSGTRVRDTPGGQALPHHPSRPEGAARTPLDARLSLV
jgi:hypothetical protein